MTNPFSQRKSHRHHLRRRVRNTLQQADLCSDLVITQPTIVRICHWGFAFSMAVILITGFILHQPASFLAFSFSQIYLAHITASWLSLSFAALRTADALWRKDHSLLAGFKDFSGFFKLLPYYLFLRDTPPPQGKYNSGQRLIYTSWIIVFVFASFCGFISYFQGKHLQWALSLLNGWQPIRHIKYGAAVYFTATIVVHIYLSLTENPSKLQAMITGYQRRKQ